MSKRKIKLMILLYAAWSILGVYADYAWLTQVPWYLIPLTAICSLYPPLLTVWYLYQYFERPAPDWFTYWIILGTSSYGLMAQFYFPLLMSLVGINFHDVGSMFWVAVYGCQSVFLLPYLKKLHFRTMLPGTLYILAADLVHFYIPTFVDFTIPGYPLWMKYLTVIVAVTLQISCSIIIFIKVQKTAPVANSKESVTLAAQI